jgi:hypothetical protein
LCAMFGSSEFENAEAEPDRVGKTAAHRSGFRSHFVALRLQTLGQIDGVGPGITPLAVD